MTGNFHYIMGECRRSRTWPCSNLIINLSSAAPVLILGLPSGQLADCQQLERQVMVSPEIESTNCAFAEKE